VTDWSRRKRRNTSRDTRLSRHIRRKCRGTKIWSRRIDKRNYGWVTDRRSRSRRQMSRDRRRLSRTARARYEIALNKGTFLTVTRHAERKTSMKTRKRRATNRQRFLSALNIRCDRRNLRN